MIWSPLHSITYVLDDNISSLPTVCQGAKPFLLTCCQLEIECMNFPSLSMINLILFPVPREEKWWWTKIAFVKCSIFVMDRRDWRFWQLEQRKGIITRKYTLNEDKAVTARCTTGIITLILQAYHENKYEKYRNCVHTWRLTVAVADWEELA